MKHRGQKLRQEDVRHRAVHLIIMRGKKCPFYSPHQWLCKNNSILSSGAKLWREMKWYCWRHFWLYRLLSAIWQCSSVIETGRAKTTSFDRIYHSFDRIRADQKRWKDSTPNGRNTAFLFWPTVIKGIRCKKWPTFSKIVGQFWSKMSSVDIRKAFI